MRLRFVCYIEGTTRVTIERNRPGGVVVVKVKDEWYFRDDGPYIIGRSVRVPDEGENKEFWGPMMVIDLSNPDHIRNFTMAIEELRDGCLTP